MLLNYEVIQMKKLLIICILIVSVIFISGCTSEDKTNSENATNSHTSDPLIRPSDLPKGYYSSEYTTFAISRGNSFTVQNYGDIYDIINSENMYEGDIPSGKKRILTIFKLTNNDNNLPMNVFIYEFDSNSGLQDYFSSVESESKKQNEEYKNMWDTNDVSNLSCEYDFEINLVGDYSVQSTYFVQDNDEFITTGGLNFCYKNYLVLILVQQSGKGEGKAQKETIQKETLKVAKAIKSGLD